jgi:hypothetical protein
MLHQRVGSVTAVEWKMLGPNHSNILHLLLLLLLQVKKVTLHDVRRMGEKAPTVSAAWQITIFIHAEAACMLVALSA